MREIKFRAWLCKTKHMVQQVGIFPTHRNAPTSSISGDGMMVRPDFPEIILMQYTGLKDKNGKEIYEGDIIKVWKYKLDYWDETEMIETTHPQKISWFYSNHFPYWTLEDLYLPGLQYVGHFDKLEVIGNIWENPELMEVKDELH